MAMQSVFLLASIFATLLWKVSGDAGISFSQHVLHRLPRDVKVSKNSNRILRERPSSESTEIFTGEGTHFTYAYVGTPPQRQSLIIHTASKHTTFPCTGCRDCGEHTDPYFNVNASTTAKILICNNTLCQSSQVYAEGSTWQGYRLRDTFYVGNMNDQVSETDSVNKDVKSTASLFAVKLAFTCQTSMQGTFWSQKENGILGMNGDPDAVPWQLLSQKAVDHKIFALCFHTNGGIMTIGGVNSRIHLQRTVLYALLEERSGILGLKLHKIRLATSYGTSDTSYGLEDSEAIYAASILNPKGVYLDSATTETYLPRELSKTFEDVFSTATNGKLKYEAKKKMVILPEVFSSLPDIVFDFYGVLSSTTGSKKTNNKYVSIRMKPTQYLLSIPNTVNSYYFRIQFTQKSGAILGSNFFLDTNVIFDLENHRVGFASANCQYDAMELNPTIMPTKSPSAGNWGGNNANDDTNDTANLPICPKSLLKTSSDSAAEPKAVQIDRVLLEAQEDVEEVNDAIVESEVAKYYSAVSACTATCEGHEDVAAYTAVGTQTLELSCLPESSADPTSKNERGDSPVPNVLCRTCRENCTFGTLVRGDTHCPDTAWSRCSAQCVRTRQLVVNNAPLYTRSGLCNYALQTVPCFMQECPLISVTQIRKKQYSGKKGDPQGADNINIEEQVDELAVISMHWQITMPLSVPQQNWSYVHVESVALALSHILPVKVHNIDISSLMERPSKDDDDTNSFQILSFEIRLRSSDYIDRGPKSRALLSMEETEFLPKDVNRMSIEEDTVITATATVPALVTRIRTIVRDRHFFGAFLRTLQDVSYSLDGFQQRRFAAYRPSDFVLQEFAIQEYYHKSPMPVGKYWFGSMSGLDIALVMLVIITGISLFITWRLHNQLRSDYVLMVQKSQQQSSESMLKRFAARFTFRPTMVASFEKMQKSLSSLGLLTPSSSTTSTSPRKKKRMFTFIGNEGGNPGSKQEEDMSHYRFHPVSTIDDDDEDEKESEEEAINDFFNRGGSNGIRNHAGSRSKQDKRWSIEPGVEMMSRY